ncbi:MAG: hypothetical protein JXA60_05560 [Candidatus Coatesbacteria bacterium]|nr:hypothetical protein [Candidatus Coatesbacteria bacterium]
MVINNDQEGYNVESAIKWLHYFFRQGEESLVDETHLLEIALQRQENGLVTVRRSPNWCFSSMGSAEEFIRGISRKHQEVGFYFGPALRFQKPPQGTHASSDNDVLETNLIYLDVDARDLDIENRIDSDIKSILERLPCEQHPHLMNFTGNGFHCFWVLKDFVSIHEAMEVSRAIDLYFQDLLVSIELDSIYYVDKCIRNPSRLMRLPETLNLKRKHGFLKKGRILLNNQQVASYSIDDFHLFAEYGRKKKNNQLLHPATTPAEKEQIGSSSTLGKANPVSGKLTRLFKKGVLFTLEEMLSYLADHADEFKSCYEISLTENQMESICRTIRKNAERDFKSINSVYQRRNAYLNGKWYNISDFRLEIIAIIDDPHETFKDVKFYVANVWKDNLILKRWISISPSVRASNDKFRQFMLETANCNWSGSKRDLDDLFFHEEAKAERSIFRISDIGIAGYVEGIGWVTKQGILNKGNLIHWDENNVANLGNRQGVLKPERESFLNHFLADVNLTGNKIIPVSSDNFSNSTCLVLGYLCAAVNSHLIKDNGLYLPVLNLWGEEENAYSFLKSVYGMLGLDFEGITEAALGIRSTDDLKKLLFGVNNIPVYLDSRIFIKNTRLKSFYEKIVNQKDSPLFRTKSIIFYNHCYHVKNAGNTLLLKVPASGIECPNMLRCYIESYPEAISINEISGILRRLDVKLNNPRALALWGFFHMLQTGILKASGTNFNRLESINKELSSTDESKDLLDSFLSVFVRHVEKLKREEGYLYKNKYYIRPKHCFSRLCQVADEYERAVLKKLSPVQISKLLKYYYGEFVENTPRKISGKDSARYIIINFENKKNHRNS